MSRSSPRFRVLGAGLTTAVIIATAGMSGDALAAACPRADAAPLQARHTAIADATLCLMNAERRGHGLRPVQVSRPLTHAALAHSRDMVRRQYFAHTAPEGAGVVHRIRHAGYLRTARRWTVAENIGWGSLSEGSARAIVRAWMHSPPHRKAILTPSYHDVGIGISWGAPRPLGDRSATFTVDFGHKR